MTQQIASIKQEITAAQTEIEICDGCKSGDHGCEQYFCMCECRHPLPWREGNTIAYSTIEDANGKTLLYDVISNKRPSEIRARVLRAVNNHDALVEALEALEPYLTDEASMLDYASLNEGRASGFDVASMKARSALSKVRALAVREVSTNG